MNSGRRTSRYEYKYHVQSDASFVKKQKEKKVPVFENPIHLIQSLYKEYYNDKLINWNIHKVYEIANNQEKHYKKILIPKKNGKMREINEPEEELKKLQKVLASRFFKKFYSSKLFFCANGFIKGRSIKTNAQPHLGKKYLLKLDIKDFFPSIKEKMVYQRCFGDNLYSDSVKTLITKLVTLNEGLPQGAPTSPIVSNIVMSTFDMEIMKYCLKHDLAYTRYADDISISSKTFFDRNEVISFIKEKLLDINGMKLNLKKIVFVSNGQRKEICGVVVNEKLQTPKKYRDAIRQEMNFINKNGIQNHINYLFYEQKIEKQYSVEEYSRILLGKINHVLNIDKNNKQFIAYKSELEKNTGKKVHPDIDREEEIEYKKQLGFYIHCRDNYVLNIDTCSDSDKAIHLFSNGESFKYKQEDPNNDEQRYIAILSVLSKYHKNLKTGLKNMMESILYKESKTSKLYAYLMIMLSQTFKKEYRKQAYDYWLKVGMALNLSRAYLLASSEATSKEEKIKLIKKAADLKDGKAQFIYAHDFLQKYTDEYITFILASSENGYYPAHELAGDIYFDLNLNYFALNSYMKTFNLASDIENISDLTLLNILSTAERLNIKIEQEKEIKNELDYRGIFYQ